MEKDKIEKPLLSIRKFKELTELIDSMSKEEKEILMAGLEYYQLHLKFPKFFVL